MKTKEERHNAYIKRRPEEIKKARQWQMDNPEKVKQYKWQFRQDKPMVHRYYNLKSKKKDKMKMTAEEFNSWYANEIKECFYCDIPLDLLAFNNRYTNHRDSHNLFTIDRKECGGDYSLENIVLACPLCNLVKSNFFEADTMRELAQRYIKPRWQRKAGIEPDALFPDGCANCDTPLLREGELYQKLEEAKKQERERIWAWGHQMCDTIEHTNIPVPEEIGGGTVKKNDRRRRRCVECWNTLLNGQALKEEK